MVRTFIDTVTVLENAVGARAFRPVRAVNAAVVDSMMTGVARRIEKGTISNPSQVAERYNALIENPSYRRAVESGTSQKPSVEARIELTTKVFSDVK